jgi:hypothetical protein
MHSASKQTAIYFAKQAYDLWLMRGHMIDGFMPTYDGYIFYHKDGFRVYLRENGALVKVEG